MKRVLFEALVVAAAGLLLALSANFVSPRGLKLTRHYFPAATTTNGGSNQNAVSITSSIPVTVTAGVTVASTNKPSQQELLAARLRLKGLQLADSNTVFSLFQDPKYQQGLVIFLDARDDDHFQAGHVPSAYQFDYYRYEKYLSAVMPAALSAQQIVVYCNGGDCEDSEFTALLLSNSGIPAGRFLVYGGGFKEWKTNGWPVEIGVRNSGVLTNQPVRP